MVQTLSLALDLASLRELPLALPGVELEAVRVQRAALQQMVVSRLQQRLFGIAVSVLRSSGLFGSASKVRAQRGALPAACAKLLPCVTFPALPCLPFLLWPPSGTW